CPITSKSSGLKSYPNPYSSRFNLFFLFFFAKIIHLLIINLVITSFFILASDIMSLNIRKWRFVMSIVLILSFLSVSILLTIAPGPDNLFVLAQSIAKDKKAGIMTSLGLCTGLLVHITAATIGLSALIYQSVIVFSIIKFAGAAYLLYLAYRSFTSKESNIDLNANDSYHY